MTPDSTATGIPVESGSTVPEAEHTDNTPSSSDDGATTVLVAEDQSELAELYVASLPDAYAIRVARDGEEALSLVDGAVDVALLDRQMPRLTGAEVLDRIREAGYGCRVAMLTGVDPDFDVLDMDFDEYLVKPVSVDQLRAVVDRLLALSAYDAAVREYYALLSKRNALRSQKHPAELQDDEGFAALESEIEALSERLDGTLRELDDVHPGVLFDDLDGNA